METSITPVIIVMGFLGSGKTTLINKLLEGALSPSETVLVENEFGEVSIDDDILSASGMTMRTLASGCICCTLSANFIAEIPEIIETYHPKALVIEPTGMACPMDLLDICKQIQQCAPIEVTSVMSVINAQNIQRVLKLNIPAFNRQFENVSYVILTHLEGLSDEQIEETKDLILDKVGSDVPIIATPLESVDALEILAQSELAFSKKGNESGFEVSDSPEIAEHDDHEDANQHHDFRDEHEHDNVHDHGHEHVAQHEDSHEHAHDNHHHHHHHDHESFGNMETKTFYPMHRFSTDELEELIARIDAEEFGTIVRVKGFLKSADNGMVLLEHVLDSGSFAPTHYQGEPKLVVIGRDIDETTLSQAIDV